MHRLRQYTWASLGMGPVMVLCAGVVDLGLVRHGLLTTVGLALALVVVFAQHTRYLRLVVRGTGPDGRWPEHLATFAVALASWGVVSASASGSGLWCLVPAAVIGHVVLLTPRPTRWYVVVVGTAATIAVAAACRGDFGLPGLLMTLIPVLTLVFTDVLSLWFWLLVQDLDRAHDTARALAVAEERLRFAADLHDIQGHHLQVIALKGELTERLIGRDDETARKHAGEIADLARTALEETRGVVQGYRRASLGTEITNAVGILAAAGITTSVEGDAGDVPAPLQPLFGALVREGTTNVLRHSSAQRCTVAISVREREVHVRLHNDGGAGRSTAEPGAGLAGLRERFAAVGGRVEAGATPDGFELAGRAGVGR
ncbi:two-component system sensor histidine kinase DesK [Umezawaea tangerina]|uniref:Two-component system sensor histidine kinase DesK n=2 Tax=Umezawaea tangerina TaxID=84725 RepID=A0A2T0SRN6_9PSEU|nr:two-component system sensor histidine kinase DesK [Umezawaea tangerina]